MAQIIKSRDANHPVSTVISGAKIDVVNMVVRCASTIEVMGINTYGGRIHRTRKVCEESSFEGPCVISEWGPYGHWEVEKTSWKVPIEQTSAQKAATYECGYSYIYGNKDLFLGSYVFLWGQKEEITPTWYGAFLESKPDLGVSNELCPTVDVMKSAWSGCWPSNQAPAVTSIKINGLQVTQNVTVEPGQKCTGVVEAADPDGDEMTVIWEILKEATILGFGGSYEPRPDREGEVVSGSSKEILFNAPKTGEYRLYA